METLIHNFVRLAVPALYGLCFAGLAYTVAHAFKAGAEDYAKVHAENTARQFADIFFFIPPRRIVEIAWIVAATSFLICFFCAGSFESPASIMRGLFAGSLAGAAALSLPRQYLKFLKRKRLRLFNEQLVDALMTMSNALRSGSSITQAFEHIARQNLFPISQEFDFLLQQLRVGVKFEEALANMESRVRSEDLTLMIRAIEIARRTGGNLTEVFDKIAAVIRERIRIQGRINTLTAQGRMQGIIVGIMPLGLALAMFIIDPAMMAAFFASPTGWLILTAMLILEGIGALLIRKIINIDI